MQYSVGEKIKTRINKIQDNGCFCSFFPLWQKQFGFMPNYLMPSCFDENGNITINVGDDIEVIISKITARGIILSDILTFEKEQEKIKEKEYQDALIDDFVHKFEAGTFFEVEVIQVKKNKVIIRLGELKGIINKEDTNWNEIDRLEDSVFEGEVLKAVFIKHENHQLFFSTKLLNEKPYEESLYKLSLNELLKFAGHDTNTFIGEAKQYGKYTFIVNLYSCSENQRGKLLIDPIYGYNLRAIVPNANFNIEEGHFYKIALSLTPQIKRIERNQLFQFFATEFEETPNPYKAGVNLTFEKFTSPAGNVATAHLLEEVGKNMYSSKDRMFFELVQNADDAASQKGVCIKVKTNGDYLIVSHNGYSFDKDDFDAITSAANGTKKANENKTGYKGIGFKSVFTDSSKVFIKTGGYQFKFDKSDKRFTDFDAFYFSVNRLTTDEQKSLFLQKYNSERSRFRGVSDIPWQLEPIWIDTYPAELGDAFMSANVAIALLLGKNNIEGYDGYRLAIDEIINNPKFMLFLRKTNRIDFNNKSVSKEIEGDTIILKNSFASTRIEYFKRKDFEVLVSNASFEKSDIDIRIKIEEEDKKTGKIIEAKFVDLYGQELENIPKKIAINNSTTISFAISIQEDGSINPNTGCNEISMFAFLPTLVKDFKFPFFINANFILDPPRQRILGDNPWNFYLMQEIAKRLVSWSASLSERRDRNALNILVPKYFEEDTTDTKRLAEHFNSTYRNALESEAFILNHKGDMVLQEEIIIDKTGLSEIIGEDLFCQILNTSKKLPSNIIDSKILKESIFERIEALEFNIVIDSVTDSSNFNKWYIEASEEDKQVLYKWIADKRCKTHEDKLKRFVLHLPLFQFADEYKSYEEIDSFNYIFTTEHIIPIKEILSKLGFKCSDNLIDKNFPLFDFIGGQDEEELFQSIKVCDFSNLDAVERFTLFCALKDFNGIGVAKLKEIPLFKNMNGDFTPLKEMVAYRKNYPLWLSAYVLNNIDNHSCLSEYLISQDDEFDEIIRKHYDDLDVSISELYETYKPQCTGPFIRHLIDNRTINDELLTIVEESDTETKKYFLNSIKKLDLFSTSIYKKISFESRTLQLALSVLSNPSVFSSKVFLNDQCIKEFSIIDDVICEYTQNGVKKKVRMSLAKLLPQYKNKSDSINKFKELFEIKKDLNKFFNAEPMPLYRIVKALEDKDSLGLSPGEWVYDKNGNAYQYLFYVYYYYGIKGYTSSWVISIKLENETEFFINEMMNFLFNNDISIKESPFTYRIRHYFRGKNLSDDYLFNEEKLIPSIQKWADSIEKRQYLIQNGVLDGSCHYVLFRSSFLEDKYIESIKLSDIELRKSIEYIATTDGYKKPFIGENQKDLLLNIRNKGVRYLVSRCNFAELNSKSEEWNSDIYNKWKEERRVQIFLIDGKIPMELLYENTVLLRFSENDFIYDSSKLYISKDVELNIKFFDIASKGRFGVSLDDYKTLFMSGRVSVSKREIDEKNKQILDLQKENQEKDELLKKYRDRFGELSIAKKNTIKVSNTEILAIPNDKKSDKTVHLAKADTNILSQQEQIEAQLEAQKYLLSIKPMWKFPENFAEVDEEGKPYCFSTFEITDEEGKNKAIVLKSFKKDKAPFSINPEEWDYLTDSNAKLVIYRGNGYHEELGKEDLIRNQNCITLRFSTENLDIEDRISQFSDILHYFKQIHFDFESFNVPNRAKSISGITNKKQGTQPVGSEKDI